MTQQTDPKKIVVTIATAVMLSGLALFSLDAQAQAKPGTAPMLLAQDDTQVVSGDDNDGPVLPAGLSDVFEGNVDPDDENDLPYAQIRRFALVYAAVKNRYVETVKDEDLVNAAIEGMLNKLDPHSSYLNKEDLKDLLETTEGEFAGLGIEVSSTSKKVSVIAPIENSPADKAGIMPGDEIVEINGKKIEDHPVNEVVKQLRGDPGTVAKLKVKRRNKKELIAFEIKRDLVKINSVRSKLLDSNIAYIRISQFQEHTTEDLVKHLKDFKKEPSGLVLDLRNNPGGLLNAAVGVAGAFLPPKTLVVYTKSRNKVGMKYHVAPSDYSLSGQDALEGLPKWTRKVPVVVLINVGSASASEIVSGALQDYERSVTLGTRSFGKGSVQVVMPVDEGTGIKLTIARYYTPNGRSIQATGIKPDVLVSDTPKGDLFAYPREADLRDHLANDVVDDRKPDFRDEEDFVDIDENSFDFGSKDDFQLQQAINKLTGKTVNHGTAMDQHSKKSKSPKDKKAAETKHTDESKSKDASADKAAKPKEQESNAVEQGDKKDPESSSSEKKGKNDSETKSNDPKQKLDKDAAKKATPANDEEYKTKEQSK